MNSSYEPTPYDARIEALARRAGAERSLYLGEAIGNALAIAWQAIEWAATAWRRRTQAPGLPAKTQGV
jgi:hypothetical protein